MELLNRKLNKLAIKDDFSSLTLAVQNVVTDNKVLKCEIESLNWCNKNLLKQIVELENRSRRNNLIFKGLDCGRSDLNYRDCDGRFLC